MVGRVIVDSFVGLWFRRAIRMFGCCWRRCRLLSWLLLVVRVGMRILMVMRISVMVSSGFGRARRLAGVVVCR